MGGPLVKRQLLDLLYRRRFLMAVSGAVLALGILMPSSGSVFAKPSRGGKSALQSKEVPERGDSNFTLQALTETPASSPRAYILSVTVAQTRTDASDFGPSSNTSSTEVHGFPRVLYLVLRSGSHAVDHTNSSPLAATWLSSTPASGISYHPGDKGTVVATAQYRVTLPAGTSSTDSVAIYPYGTPGYHKTSYAFRMGSRSDHSFSDDVVRGTATLGTLPVGQLPEIPYAALLPSVGLLAMGIASWRKNHGSVT